MLGAILRLGTRVVPLAVAGYTVQGGTDVGKEAYDEVIGIVYKVKAAMELRGASQLVQLEYVHGNRPPHNLAEFMRANMHVNVQSGDPATDDPGLDPWAEPYRIRTGDAEVVLYSCGPDRSCNTDDDIATRIDFRKL